ncbi:MAG: hypothetical protein CLLPBCKN_007690 [Chroococcidiopsis cubana SAG 39.79]|uniref:Uncharacterized protein n=1 Tax=Chroococcidiopsis cubana SAG 39.79 TaxID=388085 RepID=A0AB37USU2_9CYAN|nr:hypothetical protein [Chroococcidiopsis cubana]MDZ4878255.1 hypothetical protein [Chroococcidiopsis cubana SAG 39.79]PSB64451.1 hypothetical protein C7B79_09680 [Chroococcidiopsis cubana CCALA 043]RUT14491.1 hypothetical protein DSM107010_00370 [Chroococcidiopsis cubana SAG 39.79]
MQQVEWLDLPLWDAIQAAMTEPEDANLASLWQEVEAAIVDFDCSRQLQVAGEAIVRITELFEARSLRAFEEIQATTSHDGPVMPSNAFDHYVRQTMQIDFEQYIEPLVNLPRKTPQLWDVERTRSIVASVEPQTLIEALENLEIVAPEAAYRQAIAVSHEEDVSQWGAAIATWLNQHKQAVPLLKLVQSLGMPLVQVWLGLLHNGFALEQRGEFYQTKHVWVLR